MTAFMLHNMLVSTWKDNVAPSELDDAMVVDQEARDEAVAEFYRLGGAAGTAVEGEDRRDAITREMLTLDPPQCHVDDLYI